jgi:hypothetical protein
VVVLLQDASHIATANDTFDHVDLGADSAGPLPVVAAGVGAARYGDGPRPGLPFPKLDVITSVSSVAVSSSSQASRPSAPRESSAILVTRELLHQPFGFEGFRAIPIHRV